MCFNKKIIILVYLSFFIFGFADTYVWKSFSPQQRDHAKIIVDSLNRRAILFGGSSWRLNGKLYNDIWEMSLTDSTSFYWAPLRVTGVSPKPRAAPLFIYDKNQQRAIVFGGDTSWGCRVNDVWALNLTLGTESWQRLYPTGNPPIARTVGNGIYHPARNSIVFFGGDGDYIPVFDDVWELKLDTLRWQQILVSGNRPSARGAHAAVFDAVNNRMIIFGGGVSGYGPFYNDVWALDLTVGNEHWIQLFPSGEIPSARTTFAYGHDIKRNKLYIFGGWSDYGLLNDVYVLDIPSLVWTRLYPSGENPWERRNSAGVYDFFNDNFIIFGGNMTYEYYIGDTYILDILATHELSEWKPTSINYTPTIIVYSPYSDLIRIHYSLPKPGKIKVDIIDLSGRIVKSLFNGKINSPNGSLVWDKKNESNKKVSSGIYFCRLQTEDFSFSKKFVISK